jgi:hypothetical protein
MDTPQQGLGNFDNKTDSHRDAEVDTDTQSSGFPCQGYDFISMDPCSGVG